ncbi:uncharacterized protein LOC656019 [Tribolium castaneum]|nr:PREDICTED: uncharacterized protein LOC656019 [Tribolium castaneum]|eukprot:XP_967668.2 PREDICTED: uncharacterized protein LOC656019 [Tribolium castaneum]
MAPTIERIVDSVELGEGPHWDAATQSLYFVDIFGKTIHKYVPVTKKHTKAVIGTNHVSLIIPVEGEKNKFLITIGRQLVTVKWDGSSEKVSEITKIGEVDDDPETLDNRFNDGKCDPTGRLWAGTMGGEPINGHVKPNKGGLFSLGPNQQIRKHLSNVSISNGLAWSKDLKKMYYIDSPKRTIDEYEVDMKYGTLSNGRPIFTLEKHNIQGFPDGMAIDTDGNLWVAVFNGYRVIKIDPRKPETLLQTIQLPAKQVTSVAFGGPDLDELYVTSAAFTVDGVELPPPDHGATFRIKGIGAKGYPGVNVKLQLNNTMVRITQIGDNLEVGTRIHWDEQTQNLYYVDVPTSTIYRYRPSTDEITQAQVGNEPLAFAFPVDGKTDFFIAGLGRKIVLLKWDGESESVCSCTTIAEVDREPHLAKNRLNGAKVDPYGRLWAGTMGAQDANGQTIPKQGSLYSLTNGRLKREFKEVGISNGIAFDLDANKMYYVDTLIPAISAFDYDGESGEISNKTTVFKLECSCINGLPDGLTIDTDGNLWLAVIFGSLVLKIDPRTGQLLKKIQMPTPQITAMTWGNKNCDVLYVTSAKMAVNGKVPEKPAGCTFKLENLGHSKGLPGDRYKM